MTEERGIPDELFDEFVSRHRLPDSFRSMAGRHYLPLARRLPDMRGDRARPLLLGINGAQGTGKSTLADYLEMAAGALFGWRVAVLSIDDFYLTLAERESLAADVHPLLRTRGVPGTHDTGMLGDYLDRLTALGESDEIALPRFDKSIDDRAAESEWPTVCGPLDLVVLEGWCVGTAAQEAHELVEPVNELERARDADGRWRGYVNAQLETLYAPLFARLDALVFLKAPSFDAVFRWRLEQEQKLAARAGADAPGIMDAGQVRRFIEYYERLTRANLEALPGSADVIFVLDESHAVRTA